MSQARPAADVLVAGAGIVGCAAAWECARRGARVAVVDRGRPGGEASGAAAGMLTPSGEAHGPGAFLDMGVRSLALWPGFAAAVEAAGGGDCELALDGLLRVPVDAEDAGAVRDRLAWQVAAGLEARWVDPADLRRLEPALAASEHGAALHPGEGHVHGPRTVAALVAALRRSGADVRAGAEVLGWAGGGGVELGDGSHVDAACVVVAAGSWSGEVCARLGLEPPPVRPVRGQLLVLRGLEPPRHVLFGGLAGYAVAKRDGSVLVGATEEDSGFDRTVTESATAQLWEVARRLLLGTEGARLEAAWAGLRPRLPDGLPLVRELAPASGSRPRVVVATGHHRNGVLLAPLTAGLVAGLALS